MTNGEQLAKMGTDDLLLRINQGFFRNYGSAECVMQCLAGRLGAELMCGEHDSCAECITQWLGGEED